jgi:hypothetical protein
MSRLLFAAARGARIEQYRNSFGAWIPAEVLPASEGDSKSFRIHPDDEHLQYGPITSAWRKSAIEGEHDVPEADLPYLEGAWGWGEEWEAVMKSSAVDFDTFLLILSEALADEGL